MQHILPERVTGATVISLTIYGALAASWLHLVDTMARYEHPERWWIAALAATAIDLGIAVMVWAAGHLARQGATTEARRAQALVVVLACISVLANATHALDASGDLPALMQTDGWRVFSALAFAGVLPVTVVWLSRVAEDVRRLEGERVAAVPVVAAAPVPARATPAPARATTPPPPPTSQPAGDPRVRVQRVAVQHPHASQRELARLADTSPTTVARMMTDGVLHRNGSGWEVVG